MNKSLFRHLPNRLQALRPGSFHAAGFSTTGVSRGKFNVTVFSAKSYDKEFLSAKLEAMKDKNIQLSFVKRSLGLDTVEGAQGSHAVCIFVNDRCDGAVIKKLSQMGLKMIALRCAGFNNVDLKAARQHNIVVSRVPAYSPYSVAEFAVGSMLALNRKLHLAFDRVRSHNFSLENLVGFDVHGKTVGIIGAGKIGLCTIAIYKGMGCRVLAYDSFPNKKAASEMGFEFHLWLLSTASLNSLDQLYSKADIISIHAPLTPDNHHMINDEAIAKMRKGVMIVNCGRGPLVDTEALVRGLKCGRLGGACLDVLENESKYFYNDHSDSIIEDDTLAVLIACPNVLITSHQAFLTEQALANIAESTLGSIQLVSQGKALVNEVTEQ